MHGQIHDCLKRMILELYGREAWDNFIVASKASEADDFLKLRHYEDSYTIFLLRTTAQVLEMSFEDALETYGVYFIKYGIDIGYDSMLRSLGYDFLSFVENIDTVHALLAVSYRNIVPPSFRPETRIGNTIVLNYYSIRLGLQNLLVGLLVGAAKYLYDREIRCTILSTTLYESGKWKPQNLARIQVELLGKEAEDEGHFRRMSEHGKVALLKFPAAGKTRTHGTATPGSHSDRPGKCPFSGSAVVDGLNPSLSSLQISRKNACPVGHIESDSTGVDGGPSDCPVVSSDAFSDLFPYHIVFDNTLIVKRVGTSLRRLCPAFHVGHQLYDLVDIIYPRISFTFETFLEFDRACFVFQIRRFEGCLSFRLKGQLIPLDEIHLIFLGSPLLRTLTELQEKGVYICDFPIYDTTREFLLLNQLRHAEMGISTRLEETTAALQIMAEALEREKQKTDMLLHQMLPINVANQLREGKHVDAEKYNAATVLFSDIVSFTTMAAVMSPMDVVGMLNELFSLFDALTNKHGVYKVETIGDAYMVVGGVPEATPFHAKYIANMALDMQIASRNVRSPADSLPIKIRVGIHSGSVVAGVVGDKMPRYCLFGDTVNTASRMESHGIPGMIHISSTTYEELLDDGYNMVERGSIQIKGKGTMATYLLLGSPSEPCLLSHESPIPTVHENLRDQTADVDNSNCAQEGVTITEDHNQSNSTASKTGISAREDAKQQESRACVQQTNGQDNGLSHRKNVTYRRPPCFSQVCSIT